MSGATVSRLQLLGQRLWRLFGVSLRGLMLLGVSLCMGPRSSDLEFGVSLCRAPFSASGSVRREAVLRLRADGGRPPLGREPA